MKTNIKKNIDIETILLIVEAFNNFDNDFILHNESDCYGFLDEYVSYNFEQNYFKYYISSQSAWININGEMIYHTHDDVKNINLSLDQANYDKLLLEIKEITCINPKFELEFKDWFMKLYEWKKKIDPIKNFINEQTMSIISYVRNLKDEYEIVNNRLEERNQEYKSLVLSEKRNYDQISYLNQIIEYKEEKISEYEKSISKYRKQIRDLQSPSLWKRIFKFQKLKI